MIIIPESHPFFYLNFNLLKLKLLKHIVNIFLFVLQKKTSS